jgi:hypothetical protein
MDEQNFRNALIVEVQRIRDALEKIAQTGPYEPAKLSDSPEPISDPVATAEANEETR